jgi:hypothetical protein
MLARLPIAAAAIALLASPGVASAWNALKNGDFVGGVTPWNHSATNGGDSSWESVFGSPGAGSLRLSSYAFTATSHADQCVDVHKWSVIDFSVRQFDESPSGGGTHTFKFDIYDAASCGGNLLSTVTMPVSGDAVADGNPATGWQETSVLGSPLPSGAVSVKVNLDVVAGAATVAYFLVDNVQVVPVDEIFPDDFDGD